jgi:4'-phosphopantetheinyl transferase EntD
VLDQILPAGVESQEWFGAASAGGLLAEEEAAVAHAVEGRRREYAAVRSGARLCLQRLGRPEVPIVPGVGGAPTWPTGVRGSMTHCSGYAAAAVGTCDRISAIGIDAEPDAPLPDGVLALVGTPTEQDLLAGAPRRRGQPSWDRLLFSAKESVYKAWFPLVGEWLDPQDVEIVFHPRTATFTATLHRDGLVAAGRRVDRLTGRWVTGAGILLTAVVMT